MSQVFCEGQEVYLRTVRLADIGLIVKWKNDPLVQRMALGPDVVATVYSERKDIKRALKSEGEIYHIITLKESDQPVGYVRVNWMDASHRFAWLRFAMGAERGKGFCKDALRSLFTRLFSQGVHRIEAEAYEFNTASIGLLESLGFKPEGLKRSAHFDGKEYADIVVLGLLQKEFLLSK